MPTAMQLLLSHLPSEVAARVRLGDAEGVVLVLGCPWRSHEGRAKGGWSVWLRWPGGDWVMPWTLPSRAARAWQQAAEALGIVWETVNTWLP